MTALVLDASAALALVLAARGRDEVRRELRDRIVAAQPVLVPALFWVQVVDGLTRRRRQRPEVVVEAVYELEQLGLETAEVGRPGVLALVDAVGRGLDAPHAAYLVLAESADADLLTTDASLAAVAGARAILAGGHAGRPPRLPGDRSWTRWKGAAAYLRELRSGL